MVKSIEVFSQLLRYNVSIEWDGKHVWINSEWTGENLARFSKFAFDLHRSMSEQEATGIACLSCFHRYGEKLNSFDYDNFVDDVKVYYGIDIPTEVRPRIFPLSPPIKKKPFLQSKNGAEFPCQFADCGLSRLNNVHKNKRRSGYHEYVPYEEEDV